MSSDNRIALFGDWHGNALWARHAIAAVGRSGVQRAYHLGDFGLGWPGAWGQYISEVAGSCIKHDVYIDIVPGNHENYDWINARLLTQAPDDGVIEITGKIRVLPRGYRTTLPNNRTLVALGGAPSIDFPNRTEGISWWRQEMITLEEAEAVAAAGHADIMLAHDSPDGGTQPVQDIIDSKNPFWTPQGLVYAEEGRKIMNIAVAGVQPKVFAHGHFHIKGESQDPGGTKWLSLNCDGTRALDENIVLLDLETLDHEWLEIT